MWLFRSLSLPYLLRHKLRTSLTLIGIAAGVATMVATGTVCDSIFSSFATTVHSTMGGAALRITASGLGLSTDVVEKVRVLAGVSDAGSVVDGFVSLPDADDDSVAVIGIDLLADPRSAVSLRDGVIEIPDQITFLSEPDSVVLPRSFAQEMNLELGSSFVVSCPVGKCRLVVRGLMPDGGMVALFGGNVVVMDLAAAQALLGKPDRVDHVDVWLVEGVELDRVIAGIRDVLGGAAWVEKGEAAAERAQQLLMAIRVFLTMAAFVAVAVGFFLVYHTVAASIQQRRQHLAVLNAVGVSKRALLAWLTLESFTIALLAIVVGTGAGVVAARAAVALFGGVTSAWVPVSAPRVALTAQTAMLAATSGAVTVVGATLLAYATLFAGSTARQLSSVQAQLSRPTSLWTSVLAAFACFVFAAALALVAPPTLPYGWLVTYVLAIVMTVMLGFGLLAPAAVRALASVVLRIARRRRGVALLLAASNVTRNPSSFVVVVTAIVMALASTLASFSLTASLRHSGLTWLTEHYRGDLVLTGEGAFLRILTSPPIADAVVGDVRAQPGVRAVQGIRAVEIRHEGLPAVLLAYDRSLEGFTLYDGDWRDVGEPFWRGSGVLVSDNLARMRGIKTGQSIELPSPAGPRAFEVLGVFPDYTGGSQLGSVAISRDTYRYFWKDDLVNRMQIWLDEDHDAAGAARTLTDRYLRTHGLRALTLGEIRDEVALFIDDAFSVMYALVAVSLFVSFVGVVNFLSTVLADRHREMDALRGIGVSPSQAFAAIVTEGGLVGVTGAIIGVTTGLVVSAIITFHSVPMVTGWKFLFVFPALPAAMLAAGAIALSAGAGLPAALAASRWRPTPDESAA